MQHPAVFSYEEEEARGSTSGPELTRSISAEMAVAASASDWPAAAAVVAGVVAVGDEAVVQGAAGTDCETAGWGTGARASTSQSAEASDWSPAGPAENEQNVDQQMTFMTELKPASGWRHIIWSTTKQVIEGFNRHYQASVHFSLTSAINKFRQYQNNFFGMTRIEPRAEGWVAQKLQRWFLYLVNYFKSHGQEVLLI